MYTLPRIRTIKTGVFVHESVAFCVIHSFRMIMNRKRPEGWSAKGRGGGKRGGEERGGGAKRRKIM
jgi:hypothetical protein